MFIALESYNLKIVFILLTKVIALHMQIIIVKIGVLKFKKLIKFFSYFSSWGLVPESLNTSLYKLLEEVIV